jgi:hypothetical protein
MAPSGFLAEVLVAAVHMRVLKEAAKVVRGTDALAAALGVTLQELVSWMRGDSVPPTPVFLQALDIIAGGPVYKHRSGGAT